MSDPWFVALVGVFLLVISLAGMRLALRAGTAQAYYFTMKYGSPVADTFQLLEACRKAYALYPWNYYFSILAAEAAYSAWEQQRRHDDSWFHQASLWCERGLRQNPWKSQLRRVQARLLWRDSPREAIRVWREYTDWHFWEPYNHAVLAEMYAMAGDFPRAEAELLWTEGTVEEQNARRAVDSARQEWAEALEGDWGE